MSSGEIKQRAGETESGLRRRKIRRRAQQRRSLTEPRPPPNDEELRWKSRQRYSEDSGPETDDEGQPRYHTPSRPSLNHFLTEGDKEAPEEGRNVLGIQLEPIKMSEEHGRSQSIISNVGTESSGQKDSGFSDLHVRSEEESTVRHINETPVTNDADEIPEELEHPETIPEGEGSSVSSVRQESNESQESRAESSKDAPAAQTDPELSAASKRTFLLRRSKSERKDDVNVAKPRERVKLKPDIPLSVIQAAQTKTRK